MPVQATLADTTRRLVSEASAEYFTKTQINNHLLTAWWNAQQKITEIAPDEFLAAVTADIVAGQARYQRPTREMVRRYEILPTATATTYQELPLINAERSLSKAGATLDPAILTPRYYIEGPDLVIVPTPAENITAGLACVYVSPGVLGTGSPQMPIALHHLLPYGAAVEALNESKDAAEDIVAGYRRRWESVFGPSDEARLALRKHYKRTQSKSIEGRNLG